MSNLAPNKVLIRVAATDDFFNLERDSRGRNRGPNQQLLDRLDPDGIHVISMQMIHNDREWRCLWLCKISDDREPVRVTMDNGMEALDKYTVLTEVSDKNAKV